MEIPNDTILLMAKKIELEKEVDRLKRELDYLREANSTRDNGNNKWFTEFETYITTALGYYPNETGFANFEDAMVTLIKAFCTLKGVEIPKEMTVKKFPEHYGRVKDRSKT